MSKLKKIFLFFGIFIFLSSMAIFLINIYVLSYSNSNYYHNLNDLEDKYVWLVFGAAVYQNSVPSWILRDRLSLAYDAYESWKIKKIIVSWDNSETTYNEPNVMKKYLIERWVKKEDIYADYAWFDTYDSLYRAREIFLVNELVLFTQDFHLKRAMYIWKKLWIDVYWVETNLQPYMREKFYDFREVFARVKAFLNVELLNSKPKYLWDTIEIVSDEVIEQIKKEILENQ